MKAVIQDKIEHAGEIKERITSLCLQQCESPNAANLLRIGTYIGDFTNTLRSALNYTIGDFAENKLTPILSPNEQKKIKNKHDFPWSDSKSGFDKLVIVRHLASNFVSVYEFLERVQSYYPKNEWLKHLMRISNTEKHRITNEVLTPDNTVGVVGINPDGIPHSKPQFIGNNLMVTSGKEPQFHLLPCYYYPYGLFALKEKRWAVFLIAIDQSNLGLTRFIEKTPKKVENLIKNFNALV